MNVSLPIHGFQHVILQTIRDNAATIITAETGAGKSTQVPQMLLQAGYTSVVTQPRRLAARTVAARVAEERGEELGGLIGVRTRDDRVLSNKTRCLFATDGLALVRELLGHGSRYDVLVIDEVHEWNLNIEVLVAWAKLQLDRHVNFKVVLMSATMEAEKMSAYFNGAPVITVPGRMFPVTEQEPGADEVTDAIALLRKGRNVLMFQPGKGEIMEAAHDLQTAGVSAEVIPLHGELTADEQARAFKKYSRPKCVIATNVAQTSITIDDIDAVVDSGMERRTEVVNGVEGLYLKAISLADRAQRSGRAGRTKPGIYVDHCNESVRPEFPKAEILRTRLDQTVLRLLEAGFDPEELTFFHQPDRKEIHEAKRALRALGCLDADGKVTKKGERVAKMPIGVETACMVIEAEKRGVVDDVLTIAAIIEIGQVTSHKDEYGCPTTAWKDFCRDEQESDVLAQLAVFRAAEGLSKDQMKKKAVHIKSFFKTKDVLKHLRESLTGKVQSMGTTGKREDIIKAICAGMVDHLYRRTGMSYVNGDGVPRQMAKESVVQMGYDDQWVVGVPWDLEIKDKRYGDKITLKLVRLATKVTPAMLIEVAPDLAKWEEGALTYLSSTDTVVCTRRYQFNGQLLSEETVVYEEHPEKKRLKQAYRREQQFMRWGGRYEPMTSTLTAYPDIREEVYGTDPETGEKLHCYGVLRSISSFMEQGYRWGWFLDREDAEHAYAVEAERFALNVARNAEKKERALLWERWDGLFCRVEEVMERVRGYPDLPRDLREELRKYSYGADCDTLNDLRAHVTGTEDCLRRVEDAMQQYGKRKVEAPTVTDLSKLFGGAARVSVRK